ncbi:UNVERIFIED_ORG: ppGpp synthetase/RelA/SpoT-type nucleotidyltransferase [Paenarthrobacter nicotinovorans]
MDDVPGVIDDLVGLRLICNNLSDINTFQEIIGELPSESAEATYPLAVEPDSHRDYFANPKSSGYRAYHVNLVVPISQTKDYRRIRVEIQARTLLQDGWGELTHEDTYKPGSVVPEWILGMSLRMAELLAAVDNIAQDLRTGLDVEAQRSVLENEPQPADEAVAFVASGSDAVVVPTPHEVLYETATSERSGAIERDGSSEIETALISETLAAVHGLRKPLALAALSQQLTTVFGSEITRVWANFGGFKHFLEAVAPEAKLSGPAPGYIHPPNTQIPDMWLTEDTGTGAVPEIVRELRTYDKALPLIGPERMEQVIEAVTHVLQNLDQGRAPGNNLTAAEIDTLARQARSAAELLNQLVVRPHAAYVLQAANRAGRISRATTAADLRSILVDRILTMGELNGLITKSSDTGTEVRAWLGHETTETNQERSS